MNTIASIDTNVIIPEDTRKFLWTFAGVILVSILAIVIFSKIAK